MDRGTEYVEDCPEKLDGNKRRDSGSHLGGREAAPHSHRTAVRVSG